MNSELDLGMLTFKDFVKTKLSESKLSKRINEQEV